MPEEIELPEWCRLLQEIIDEVEEEEKQKAPRRSQHGAQRGF
ncbi:hypothetical protein C5S31_03360 [ANME-1 cluster archaeon GoMg2]|nr:hypothetical protein [ANME-1 cluster archaeon GoMg2]